MTHPERASRFRVIPQVYGAEFWPPPFEQSVEGSEVYERRELPFILDPSGEFDVELNRFWSDSAAAVLGQSTLNLYATHVAAFLDFVWHRRSKGVRRTWRDVNEQDRRVYHYWRNTDPQGPRVAANTWNSEVIAINQFYDFQVAVGNLTVSPVRKVSRLRSRPSGGREKTEGPGELRRPKKSSSPWFMPSEFRPWRDVGMRGYLPDGLRDPEFRGDQSARNAAFANLMFGTGMRLEEQSSLLLSEVPAIDDRVMYSGLEIVASVAKFKSAREVLVAQQIVREVATYVEADRDAAVMQARRTGAYDLLADKLVVNSAGKFMVAPGQWMTVDKATPKERWRLFRQTSEGLEPLALWLTRSGMPMRASSWQGVFKAANKRVARHGLKLYCNVHKLRHSWATIALTQLQRKYNLYRSGVAHGTAIGDPLNWVSRRLGHSQIETTMRYVHQLREIEAAAVLALIPDSDELVALPSKGAFMDDLGLRLG